jgi:hypothetical protein
MDIQLGTADFEVDVAPWSLGLTVAPPALPPKSVFVFDDPPVNKGFEFEGAEVFPLPDKLPPLPALFPPPNILPLVPDGMVFVAPPPNPPPLSAVPPPNNPLPAGFDPPGVLPAVKFAGTRNVR